MLSTNKFQIIKSSTSGTFLLFVEQLCWVTRGKLLTIYKLNKYHVKLNKVVTRTLILGKLSKINSMQFFVGFFLVKIIKKLNYSI